MDEKRFGSFVVGYRQGGGAFGKFLRMPISALALVAGIAMLASSPVVAAEQDDAVDDSSSTALTVGNSAKFTAPAAGTDEIFTIGAGVTVGEGGIVVSATTANGVGALTFAGASTATGTIGATGNRLGILNAGATGTTATFTGNIFAVTTNVTGGAAGTIALQGDLTGTTLDFDADGTVTLATGKNITAAITATTANNGTLTLAGTHTITGAIGVIAGGNELKLITLAGGGVVTTTANVAATSINFTGDGNLKIATGNTVEGAITTGTTNTGTLTMDGAGAISSQVGANGAVLKLVTVGNGAVAVNGDVYATAVNFAADNTSTVAADKKIVGAVTTGTTNTGTLTFATTTAATTLVSGNVGASGALLKAVNSTAGNGITNTFGGDIYATTTTFTGGNATSVFAVGGDISGTTLALVTNGVVNIAAGKNVTAAVTTGTANIGTLNFAGTNTVTGNIGVIGGNEFLAFNVNAGTVTMGGNFAAATTTVAASSTLKTTAARTYEGIIANSGTLDLGGTLTATSGGGALALGASATSAIVLGQVSVYAGGVVINATDTNVTAANAVTVTPHTLFTSGTLTLVDVTTGTNAASTQYTVTGNALTSYAVTGGGGATDLTITATRKASSAIAASLGTTASAGNALGAGVDATANDATVTAAYNTALTAGGAEAKKAAEQSEPIKVGAGTAAMAQTGSTAFNTVNMRLASIREGGEYAGRERTGFATGNSGLNKGVWMRPFANVGDQDKRDGFEGYNSITGGLAGGFDAKVGDNSRIGVGVSYGRSWVDGDGVANNQSDIDSYQGMVYGDYTASRFYFEGMAGYAYNEVNTERSVTFGGLRRTAQGDYQADQYMGRIGAGIPITIASGHVFTPNIGYQYTRLNGESYTETGAGALNLRVNPDDTNIGLAMAGLRYNATFSTGIGSFKPELRAGMMYDTFGESGQSSSTFTGGGAAFATTGADNADFSGTGGAGLTYTAPSGVISIRADYDAEAKEDFVGHSGRLEGRWNF